MTSVTRRLSRELRKRVETGHGFGCVPDGIEIADVTLTIDMDALCQQIGFRAMKNTSGKAKYFGGLVVAKVSNRKRVG